jgi:transglutaminase-like putative cysteine protease
VFRRYNGCFFKVEGRMLRVSYKPLALCGLLVLTGCTSEGARDNVPSFDPWTETARYVIDYAVDLRGLPQGTRLWIPAPSDTPFQEVISTEVTTSWDHLETMDSLGNRILYFEAPAGQTENTTQDNGTLVVRYEVRRSPATVSGPAIPGDESTSNRFLGQQSRIPLDGLIAELSEEHGAGLHSNKEKSRAFYDYVLETMRYSKDGEGWGQGDAIWACTAKYGNCTDFHSLLIGLNRSAGIPARFLIGLPVPAASSSGEISGYHCWAEVAHGAAGWLPVDASEAWKAKKFDRFYGTLPSDRVEFSRGRDLVLDPPQEGDPLNFFIYPYAEVDGQPVPKVPASFRFRRLPQEESS